MPAGLGDGVALLVAGDEGAVHPPTGCAGSPGFGAPAELIPVSWSVISQGAKRFRGRLPGGRGLFVVAGPARWLAPLSASGQDHLG